MKVYDTIGSSKVDDDSYTRYFCSLCACVVNFSSLQNLFLTTFLYMMLALLSEDLNHLIHHYILAVAVLATIGIFHHSTLTFAFQDSVLSYTSVIEHRSSTMSNIFLLINAETMTGALKGRIILSHFHPTI